MAVRRSFTISVAAMLCSGNAAAASPTKLLRSSHAVTPRVERSRARAITAICVRGRRGEPDSAATCIGDAPRVGAVAIVISANGIVGRFTVGEVTAAVSECPSSLLWAVQASTTTSVVTASASASRHGSPDEWLVFGGEFRSGAKVIQDSGSNDELALLQLDRDADGIVDVRLTTEGCTSAVGDCVSLFVRDPEWKMQRRFEFGCKQ